MTQLKSDQNGIEIKTKTSATFWIIALKSDQNGIEMKAIKELLMEYGELKSDQNGIEISLVFPDNSYLEVVKIRPKWD